MDLSNAPESGNVEDRRGMKTAGMAVGGGLGLLILIVGLVFGVDTSKLVRPGGGGGGGGDGQPPADNYKAFAGKVVGSLEGVWEKQFADPKNRYPMRKYEHPKLILFSEGVNTGGCGFAPSAVGPFYCPADKTMYLDPTFFFELEQKLGGSKAEISQAYVIAHENGHHVQNLLGFSGRVDRMRKTPKENEYSIRLELQADYLAGVWAHHADKQYRILENPRELQEAIKTAKAIGDDRIQSKMQGRVHPESFNHGTAEQRVAAFTAGANTGDARMSTLEQYFEMPFVRTGEIDPRVFQPQP